MSETRVCTACAREIPAGSPGGVCPHCALEAGLHGPEVTPVLSGGPARPAPPQEVASHFPELEAFELIGPGGMGTVYRARQRELGRPVAVKVMHAHLAADPSFVDRFTREARTLARLDHPNIVRVYDGGHRQGLAYLIMELVEGTTLRQAMGAGGLSPQQTLTMVPLICRALQYAHDHGVVHRDIKPENILLDGRGSLKVADFGLVKLVGTAEPRLTLDEQVMGTPHYMAPEQIERPGEVDHRADIYALGVLFYEMLTGELPVGRFAPPSERAAVDPRLDRIVLRALEKEPQRRYPRAADLQAEVETLSSLGVAATDVPRPAPTSSSAGAADTIAPPSGSRALPLAVLAAAVVVTLALAVAVGIYLQRTAVSTGPPPAAPSAATGDSPLTAIAVLPFADMSAEGDQEWLANGMAEELIESLSRIKELRVIARTSAFALRGQDLATVGERLGVGSVVEGSVRRSGDDLRITAQLVRTADGSNAWSARYDRKLDDVFAIQSQIAREIAEAIRSELGVDEAALYGNLSAGRYVPKDVRAYELVRKGIETGTFTLTEPALREGSQLYRQALKIDPDYADAHAMLGMHDALNWIIGYDRSDERLASARAAAETALQIEAGNSTAQQVLALLAIHQGEFARAEDLLERALEQHPQSGGLRMRYAEVLAQTGRLDEALRTARRAVELDPLAPVRHFELGNIYLLAGRYDAAIDSLEYALELNPRQLGVTAYLSSAYHLNGMDRQALEIAVADLPQGARELESPMRRGFEEGGYIGMVRSLSQALEGLAGRPCGFDASLSAHFYAITGETERMYDCLEEAVAADRVAGLYLQVHPVWAPYRGQERFRALLRRFGLDS